MIFSLVLKLHKFIDALPLADTLTGLFSTLLIKMFSTQRAFSSKRSFAFVLVKTDKASLFLYRCL